MLFLAGCRKEEKKPEIPASSPASYMNDKAFRRTLEERRKVAYSIGADRAKVEERLNEMRRIIGDKLGTKDRAAIESALAGNAEWKELQARAKELDAAFERQRKETLGIVRERITPKRGEATSSSLQGKSGRSDGDVASPLGKSGRSGGDAASPLEKDISK